MSIPDDPKLGGAALDHVHVLSGDLWNMATPDFSQGEVVARTDLHGTAQIIDLADRVKTYANTIFPSGVSVEFVGAEQAWGSLAQETVPNTELTLAIALVAALLIVTILLRSIVAGLVAVTPMILTIVINLGTMSYLGMPLDLATLMIGSITVGVGIDYTINFIVRWRDRDGPRPHDRGSPRSHDAHHGARDPVQRPHADGGVRDVLLLGV